MIKINHRFGDYFTLEELTHSNTAARLGIENEPDNPTISNLRHLTDTILTPIRMSLGCPLTISSGYRSPELNAKVGGAKNSYHTRGLAADLRCNRYTARQLFDIILDLQKEGRISYDKMILENAGKTVWVHIQVQPVGASNRCMAFGLDKNTNKTYMV